MNYREDELAEDLLNTTLIGFVERYPIITVAVSFGAGLWLGRLASRTYRGRRALGALRYPNRMAVSEVTGGHPEDINGMPASTDPWNEDPVYDGSDLSRHAI